VLPGARNSQDARRGNISSVHVTKTQDRAGRETSTVTRQGFHSAKQPRVKGKVDVDPTDSILGFALSFLFAFDCLRDGLIAARQKLCMDSPFQDPTSNRRASQSDDPMGRQTSSRGEQGSECTALD